MANALYALGRESFLKGEISWSGDNIKSVVVDSADYTPNLATDQFLSDVPAAGRATNGTSVNLTSKTTTNGSADAADVTLTAVTGDISEYVVIYQDTGVEASSRLIALIDTATGLPVTPNGGDITIQWSAPIFTL
jgi:phage tail sheath gpL-like